jgi:transketolase
VKGAQKEKQWNDLFAAYRAKYPELAAEFLRRVKGDLPSNWAEMAKTAIDETNKAGANLATRQSSQGFLNAIGPKLPELLGGSADLTGSNNTNRKDSVSITGDNPGGNYLHWGVREFGMAAALNGLALHGGFIPYGGTFVTFSDYARNAIRMSALMKINSIFVLSHDSIGLGEDGPTHQPVEHLCSLRIIPHMTLWRPCDAVEMNAAWIDAIERSNGPSILILTRQALPHQPRTKQQIADIRKGGYVLSDNGGTPDCIFIATGSEVGLIVSAAEKLREQGRKVRVVSMPSTNAFDAQSAEYRESVLPRAVTARVAVEAGVREGWWRFVGTHGAVVGLDEFGASAPGKDAFVHFGFTVDNVVSTMQKVLVAS